MVTTCFFCQNLLSDYVEGILPSNRHEEIKKHLLQCGQCAQIHHELISSISILKELTVPNHSTEFSVRIIEASESGKNVASRPLKVSRSVLGYAIPVLAVLSIWVLASKMFPAFSLFQSMGDDKQLVRYFPMSNGAIEIIEEQAEWLNSRDMKGGSVWEEGGISPEEFEKSFQKKNPVGIVPE